MPRVLVVDDNTDFLRILERVLGVSHADPASQSGQYRSYSAQQPGIDAIIADLRTANPCILELLRQLPLDHGDTPVLIVTSYRTMSRAFEVSRVDDTEDHKKRAEPPNPAPFGSDRDLPFPRSAASDREQLSSRRDPPPTRNHTSRILDRLRGELAKEQRGSSAERWARQVIRGCFSEQDLKTLDTWAKLIGVSYTALRESCYVLGIHPHEGRDFARVLRAVLWSLSGEFEPASFLDVADRRTALALLTKSGLKQLHPERTLLEQFFEAQSFIERTNPGVVHVHRVLRRTADSSNGA